MITRTPGFQVGDKFFTTVEAAQTAAIEVVFSEADKKHDCQSPWMVDEIAHEIVSKRDKIIDILTTTATSKPKARAIHGGKKVRAAKLGAPISEAKIDGSKEAK